MSHSRCGERVVERSKITHPLTQAVLTRASLPISVIAEKLRLELRRVVLL